MKIRVAFPESVPIHLNGRVRTIISELLSKIHHTWSSVFLVINVDLFTFYLSPT